MPSCIGPFLRARAAIAATVLLIGASLPGQAAETLRIAIPVPALAYYPILAAKELGYFARQGVDMDIVVTQGDGPDIDALIAGSVQFTATTPNRLLTTYQAGKPLLGIMSIANRVAINCFMNKEKADALGITAQSPLQQKLASLKGLTLGGTRPGAFTNLLLEEYLLRQGLTPQKDARVIGAGAGSAMIAAVENKRVDVACIADPTPEVAVSRNKSIMLINNTTGEDPKFSEFLFALLYVRPDYAKDHREQVVKVVTAIQQALKWVKETPFDGQKATLNKLYADVDDAILREALSNTQAAIEPSGRISAKAIDAAEAFLVETGSAKERVDPSLIISNDFVPR